MQAPQRKGTQLCSLQSLEWGGGAFSLPPAEDVTQRQFASEAKREAKGVWIRLSILPCPRDAPAISFPFSFSQGSLHGNGEHQTTYQRCFRMMIVMLPFPLGILLSKEASSKSSSPANCLIHSKELSTHCEPVGVSKLPLGFTVNEIFLLPRSLLRTHFSSFPDP